jgi:hypothetical protein
LVPCFDSLFLISQKKLRHEFAMEGAHPSGKIEDSALDDMLLVA